jgi:PAS domain S-box-containing protein
VRAERVQWSAPLEEILGEPIPDLPVPLAWWRERIHPGDRSGAIDRAEQALAGAADRYRSVYRVRRSDGRYTPVEERAFVVREGGRPLRVVAAIFRREQAPTADAASSLFSWLEQDVDRFRTFIDSLPLLAWAMTPEGWIYFYNRRWFEYTGTTPAEMEGWGWVAVHDPYDLPRILRIFRHALAHGTLWEDEFRLRRADGAMRWHLSRAMPLRDRDGRVIHWFGTNTDVHDQKLALEERSRLLEREQDARRVAEKANRAKDEFLATVSHELRSPLNAILGWAHVLEQEPLASAPGKAVSAIVRNARQQATLIEDLLDTSRILSGKLKIQHLTIALAEPVRAAVEAMVPRAAQQKVDIQVTDRSAGACVVGDGARLQQIAANLLSNALKFSREGQRVDLRLSRENAAAVLEVEDQGEGIEPEVLPRIFDRFEQADSSSTRLHGGLGLGLSIVRHLVDLHGGAVRASSPGRGLGASFRVELPLADAAAPTLADQVAVQAERVPVSLRGIRILVVDDDPEAREVLSTLLLAQGASVTSAASVAEALACLRAGLPEVVLSDIAMPEVDGYGLVERVRALADPRAARLPIVALTAFASLSDRNEALEGGFTAYLTKPVDPGELTRTLAGVVRAEALRAP